MEHNLIVRHRQQIKYEEGLLDHEDFSITVKVHKETKHHLRSSSGDDYHLAFLLGSIAHWNRHRFITCLQILRSWVHKLMESLCGQSRRVDEATFLSSPSPGGQREALPQLSFCIDLKWVSMINALVLTLIPCITRKAFNNSERERSTNHIFNIPLLLIPSPLLRHLHRQAKVSKALNRLLLPTHAVNINNRLIGKNSTSL